MFGPAWWISLIVGFFNGTHSGGAEDAAFCQCKDGVCDEQSGDPDEPACISFDEAADLAAKPGSGVFKLTTRSEPAHWGIFNASPANENAICQHQTCYVRADGEVDVSVVGNQTVFLRWSGCSHGTDPHLTVGPLTRSTECVAHMGPGLIIAHTAVIGRDDGAEVQISGSCTGEGTCSFLNGGSVTLSAPASDDRFSFVGWSGCSTSTDPTITLSNVRKALPECIAQYEPVAVY